MRPPRRARAFLRVLPNPYDLDRRARGWILALLDSASAAGAQASLVRDINESDGARAESKRCSNAMAPVRGTAKPSFFALRR